MKNKKHLTGREALRAQQMNAIDDFKRRRRQRKQRLKIKYVRPVGKKYQGRWLDVVKRKGHGYALNYNYIPVDDNEGQGFNSVYDAQHSRTWKAPSKNLKIKRLIARYANYH